MSLAYATLDEAWKNSTLILPPSSSSKGNRTRAAKNKPPKVDGASKGQGLSCPVVSAASVLPSQPQHQQQESNSMRVLENIMGIYTADSRAPISPDCMHAPYPVIHDMQPTFAADYYAEENNTDVAEVYAHQSAPAADLQEKYDDMGVVDDDAEGSRSPEHQEEMIHATTPTTPPKPNSDITSTSTKLTAATPLTPVRMYLEMLMYIASGVLLIFMMEQLIRIGSRLRAV